MANKFHIGDNNNNSHNSNNSNNSNNSTAAVKWLVIGVVALAGCAIWIVYYTSGNNDNLTPPPEVIPEAILEQ